MVAPVDITGQRFGRLVAIRDAGSTGRRRLWLFQCDCGSSVARPTDGLRRYPNPSCGCHKSGHGNKGRAPASRTHGLSRTRLYRVWKNMMSRCHNPKNHRFGDYGGRGIRVCQEWREATPFLAWAQANGYSDELQIDRIDNDLGYSPGNCHFVTPAQNMANMRLTLKFIFHGEALTLRQAEGRFGIAAKTIKHRIKKLGMTPEGAVAVKELRKGAKPKHGRYSKFRDAAAVQRAR